MSKVYSSNPSSQRSELQQILQYTERATYSVRHVKWILYSSDVPDQTSNIYEVSSAFLFSMFTFTIYDNIFCIICEVRLAKSFDLTNYYEFKHAEIIFSIHVTIENVLDCSKISIHGFTLKAHKN